MRPSLAALLAALPLLLLLDFASTSPLVVADETLVGDETLVAVETVALRADDKAPPAAALRLGRRDKGQRQWQPLLPDHLLVSLLDQRENEEGHTKLELMLIKALLKFRDALTQPQPQLGLPVLDPFEFTEGRDISVDNEFAKLDAKLVSVFAVNASKFTVDNLDLYLVERVGVLGLTVTDFRIELTLDVAKGSWVSPLKIPLDARLTVRFHSPSIKLGLRGEVSVENSKLSMESTKIDLDLGDWDLQIVDERGICRANDGLCPLTAALVRSLTPRLATDWMPVVEKIVAQRLDQILQDLQISDIIPPP